MVSEHGKLNFPTALSLDGNVQENWRIWKQNFEIYLVTTESDEKSDKVKANLLLCVIADAAKRVYNTFTFDEGDSLILHKIVEKFEAYVNPRKNITFCRFKFLHTDKKNLNHLTNW